MPNRQSKGEPRVPIRSGPVPERAEGGPISNAVCHIAASILVAGLRLAAFAVATWLACTDRSGRGAEDGAAGRP